MNRVEKGLFKSIDMDDAVRALGRGVDFTIASDFETMSTALDQGIWSLTLIGEASSLRISV